MKALIQNIRVCQIENQEFEVHPSLYWVDCDNTVTTEHTYENNIFVPPAAPVVLTEEENTRRELQREDTLLMLLYLTDGRLRILESEPPIDKETFWNQIKNVHKNQQFFDGSF